MRTFKILALALAVAGSCAVLAAPVSAYVPEDEGATTSSEAKKREEEIQKRSQSVSAENERKARDFSNKSIDAKRQHPVARLEAAKLKVCQNREARIKGIINRSIARSERHIKLFDTIADRTKTFYENKGVTLATYDALVAAVDAAHAKAQSGITDLKGLSFSCSGDNPKAVIADIRATMKAEVEALKAYRTAVKNLIVGVKSVQNTEGEG